MKVAVSGAGGFVGSFLVENLVSHGYQVRAMVRNESAAQKVSALGAEPVIADLKNAASLRAVVEGVEHIFHIAALFRQAGLPPSEFEAVNVGGTKNLLDVAIAAGVRNFTHCSTGGVHGHIENPPASETTPYNPGDHYQESKVAGEKLFLRYVAEGKIRGNVIRPAMIYGPGDTRTLKLFARLASQRFFYVGPGEALVHFIDVRDLAEAFRLASVHPTINGEVFIIAGETALPLDELVEIICTIMGVREPWLHLPVKPMQMAGSICEAICTPIGVQPPIFRRRVDFFTKDRSFNSAKARDVLGFKPAQSLVQELIQIINSYIELGMLKRRALTQPSVIVRDLDGEICLWDSAAESLYGWKPEQAMGKVTHSLLQTSFPADLHIINENLVSAGQWRGALTHTGRDGGRIHVKSNWKLIDPRTGAKPIVLEVNTRVPKSPLDGLSAFYASAAAHCSEWVELGFSHPLYMR